MRQRGAVETMGFGLGLDGREAHREGALIRTMAQNKVQN